MIADSTITCPKCGHAATERMPTDACQFFYDCKGCGQRLKPKPGDCCVFCSYGSVPCPPIQAGNCCSKPPQRNDLLSIKLNCADRGPHCGAANVRYWGNNGQGRILARIG